MAIYTSFDVVGKKEDVSDIIDNIDPTEVPFITSIGKADSVSNTLFQWQEDDIRAPAANAQTEGFTASAGTITPTTMRDNVTQIMQETFEVSGTNEEVAKYGRGSEIAYQQNKVAKALRLDLEYAYVGSAQAVVKPANNATARQMASAQRQVATANIVYTGGSGTKISEANLNALQLQLFTVGSKPTVIMSTPLNAQTIADWAKATGRTRDVSDSKEIVNVVEVYVSPYGRQKVVLNRGLKSGHTFLYNPENWKRVFLKGRNWFTKKLAVVGDKETFMTVGEHSLKHSNQLASGLVIEAASGF